jgi:hypothetical protein
MIGKRVQFDEENLSSNPLCQEHRAECLRKSGAESSIRGLTKLKRR